jgi:hypothetical protein
MATRMQQRRGTESQWGTANPILAAGEIGFEIDTNKFKIGDGINHWDDLDYFTSSSELLAIVDGAPELLDTLNEIAAAIGDDPNFSSKVVPIVKKTTVQWTADTSAIAAGTLAYDTTTGKFKIGNGTDTWSNTSYLINALEMNESITSGITARIGSLTVTEAEYLSGATASIQGQLDDLAAADVSIQSELDDKATTSNPTFTGTVVLPTSTSIGDVSSTEIGYLNGVTSGIQAQIDTKASSIHSHTLIQIEDVAASANELNYLVGSASNIQNQLNDKADIANPTFTGTVSGVTKTHVGLGNVDNTSDANKPVSTATQTALDAKANLSGATFTGDVTVETDLIVDGNLTVSGTTTTVSAQDLVVSDPLIYIGEGNTANLVDIGLVGSFDNGTYQHSGIVRDASAGKWKLFKGVTDEPTTTVNFGQGSLDDLAVNNVEVSGVVFSDGTQTKQGVPSITTISAKTDSYTLSNLDERDTIVEINKSTATTLTIPTNASVAYPVGTTLDIIQTGTGQVTIAGAGGVTVNATPGLKLRTQWSSATLLKRAENTWLVYGDLTA